MRSAPSSEKGNGVQKFANNGKVWRRARELRRVRPIAGSGLMFLQKAYLGEREEECDRHDAEDFERHPRVGGEQPPHHFV